MLTSTDAKDKGSVAYNEATAPEYADPNNHSCPLPICEGIIINMFLDLLLKSLIELHHLLCELVLTFGHRRCQPLFKLSAIC